MFGFIFVLSYFVFNVGFWSLDGYVMYVSGEWLVICLIFFGLFFLLLLLLDFVELFVYLSLVFILFLFMVLMGFFLLLYYLWIMWCKYSCMWVK